MIANCGHDERGAYKNGSSGDQTGEEWQIRSWYSRPWTHVIRHPDRSVGDTIAEVAIQGAQNDCIGYDQNQRYTFWDELKNVGYWPKNIKNKCETDCSASTAACVKATGYIRGIQALKDVSSDCYSGNIRHALEYAGFQILTDAKYLNSDSYLYNGDILLCENHHVAICVSDGSKVTRIKEDNSVKFGSISGVDLRKACNDVCNTARAQGWIYGDSQDVPRKTHMVSCDRMVFQGLYDLGYTDQKRGLETVITAEKWFSHHGFSKIHKESYLTHGDVILMKWNGSDQPHWMDHMFLLDQFYGKDNKIWKYDCGSIQRIRTQQPFQNVNFNEWSDRHFQYGFRVPMRDAKIKDGYYRIHTALGDNLVLDVTDGSVDRRAFIQLYKNNGTDAQIFYVKSIGKNLYQIQNKKSGLWFDIQKGSTLPGANLWQYSFQKTEADSEAQKFYIMDVNDGDFVTIQSYKSGLVLDVKSGNAKKRTKIQQWSLNGTRAQKWFFERV